MKNFIVWGALVVAALLIVYPLAFGGDSLLKSNNETPVKPEKASEVTNISVQTSLLSESATSSPMRPQYGTVTSYKNEDKGERFNNVEAGIDSLPDSQHVGSPHVSAMDAPITAVPQHLGDVNENIDRDFDG